MRGDEPSNYIKSISAGPSDYGTCIYEAATITNQPTSGKIYYDIRRVNGVEFSYPGMDETWLIGNAKGSHVEAEFSEENSFIGFFGEHGLDRIQLLGFIV